MPAIKIAAAPFCSADVLAAAAAAY